MYGDSYIFDTFAIELSTFFKLISGTVSIDCKSLITLSRSFSFKVFLGFFGIVELFILNTTWSNGSKRLLIFSICSLVIYEDTTRFKNWFSGFIICRFICVSNKKSGVYIDPRKRSNVCSIEGKAV